MIGQYLDSVAPGRERWLLSYADLLTLLLAFFVVMYSVSAVDEQRLEEISSGIETAFRIDPAPDSAKKAEADRYAVLTVPDIEINNPEGEWIEFVVDTELLFPSGSATVIEASNALENMLHVLASTRGKIRVEGHTDNVAISTEKFPSNWELSAARAAAVVRFLESGGIASNRLVAPVADNDTGAGRQKNRRVTFKLRETGIDIDAIADLKFTHENNIEDAGSLRAGKQLSNLSSGDPVTEVGAIEGDSGEMNRLQEQQVEGFELDQIDPVLLRQVLRELEKDN